MRNLFARRSIRQFKDAPVTPEQVTLLLQAAMAAPSAGNRKPWHFVVVRDAVTRARIAASHPYCKMATAAPVVLVPCGDPGLSFADRPAFWVQDLAAATENILLAALGLGLGAVWCGVYPNEERVADARQFLHLPPEIIPFAYVPIGVPAEEKEARTQYDADRVRFERW
ncbi:MAG: nitroreductase family protein [Chloroflexi bacterium]|nr:nitroreductase family protein [Chloroflexota bacterium]